MCLKIALRVFLYLALTVSCFSAHAAPMLNGLATHQELGAELFIGALYSEALSNDPDALINSALPMRMELKVVAPDGLATRRFSRMWIEGMAINNSNAVLTAQADNMVKFDSLFKGRLQQNDHVVFALNPGDGVDVSVNDVLLGTIEDDKFFPLLLRTWIGSVPLSSDYRANLLTMGDVPADLRTRYNAITFTPARVTAINSWKKPAPEPAQVAAAPRREAPATTPAPESTAPTPSVSLPPIARVELPDLERPDSQSGPADEEQTPPPPAPIVETPSVAVTVPPTPATATEYDEDEEDQPALTAQSLLARQFYGSDILKKIRASVRYPRISLQRNQEGSMRIALVINRDGSIASMAWVEESKHDRLNSEAWDAVMRAAPFPPLPDSLPGRTFEFTAPISFEMAR